MAMPMMRKPANTADMTGMRTMATDFVGGDCGDVMIDTPCLRSSGSRKCLLAV
jgi:hypothetical protein